MSLSTIIGNQLVEALIGTCHRRSSLILGASVVATIGSIVAGVTDSFWIAMPAFLVVMGSMGVISPVRQAYVHHVTRSEHRATVISFDAMIGSVGGAGGQLGLGQLAGARSLSAGYIVGGAVTSIAWPFLWRLHRLGGEADSIVPDGARAGTCAARGLPASTQSASQPQPVLATRGEGQR
jgi:MFS family permease